MPWGNKQFNIDYSDPNSAGVFLNKETMSSGIWIPTHLADLYVAKPDGGIEEDECGFGYVAHTVIPNDHPEVEVTISPDFSNMVISIKYIGSGPI